MSIYFSGCRTRSGGVVSAINKALESLSLGPCQTITFKFDPFNKTTTETREVLHYISLPRILASNPKCKIKTEIVSDFSQPEITFNLDSGRNVIIKTGCLSALNILKLYNKHISVLATAKVEESDEPQKGIIWKKKQKINLKLLLGKPFAKRRAVRMAA